MSGKRELGSLLGFQLSLMKLVEMTGLTVKPAPGTPMVDAAQMEELVKRVVNRKGPRVQ